MDNHKDTDFLQMPRSKEVIREAFDKIMGYKIKTEMDRKLLLGVWKYDEESLSALMAAPDPVTSDMTISASVYQLIKREQ